MKNTASETCEAVTKDLMFVSLLLERNKRGNGIEKKKKKNLKQQWLKTSQIWQTTWIYRFVKLSKTPKKMNSIKSTPRYKTAKLLKPKTEQRNLESSEREMTPLLYGGNSSNDSDFLVRSHRGQKEVTHSFQMLKRKSCQFRAWYPGKIFFKNGRGNQDIVTMKKNREFVAGRPTLKEC